MLLGINNAGTLKTNLIILLATFKILAFLYRKNNPLKAEHFDGFKVAYTAEDRKSISDERWSCYTYDQISEEGKNHSLDLGLIKDDSVLDYEDLPDPIESGEECIAQLEEAVDLLKSVVKELKSLEGAE